MLTMKKKSSHEYLSYKLLVSLRALVAMELKSYIAILAPPN